MKNIKITRTDKPELLYKKKVLGHDNPHFMEEYGKRGVLIMLLLNDYKRWILNNESVYPVEIIDDYGNNEITRNDPNFRYIHIRKDDNYNYKVKVYDVYNQGEMEFTTDFQHLSNLILFIFRCAQTMDKVKELLGNCIFTFKGIELPNEMYGIQIIIDSNFNAKSIRLLKMINFYTMKDLKDNYEIRNIRQRRKKKFLFFNEGIESPIWFI